MKFSYLKSARKSGNHTQKSIAAILGVSLATVGRYESDWRAFKVGHFCAYARAIGWAPDSLLEHLLFHEMQIPPSSAKVLRQACQGVDPVDRLNARVARAAAHAVLGGGFDPLP